MEKRSPVKIMERTHEEATEALHAGRESCHPKEASAGALLDGCSRHIVNLLDVALHHYNNVRLNSAIGYITPKDSSPGVSRRSTPPGIGSWRRRGNNG
jgi:hypothetical protein